eukprot:3776656-Alexandrium_andersonii.AAC.1
MVDAAPDFRGLAAEVEARAEAAGLRTSGEVNRHVARLVEQQDEQVRRAEAFVEQRRGAALARVRQRVEALEGSETRAQLAQARATQDRRGP